MTRSRLFIAANFIIVYGLLGWFLVVPYLRFNEVVQWDSVGHLFSSWHIREHLWPAPTGWNPFFFAGFAQGTFYSPLFHWLVASLSFLIPLFWSFKVVVSLAVLATPLSFYSFARSLFFSRSASSTAMAAMTALLFAPIVYSLENNFVGGTFASTFNIGLVANAFALPLLFFYFSAVRRSLLSNPVSPSILFALLILSHAYTAIFAAVFLALTATALVRSWRAAALVFRHLVITLSLTAFWIIPLLAHYREAETSNYDLILGLGAFVLIFLGLACALWIFLQRQARPFIIPIAFFLILIIALLSLNFLGIQLHIYRLILLPLLCVPLLVLRALPPRWHLGVAVATLGLFAWGIGWHWIDVRGAKISSRSAILQALPQRTFLLSSPYYQEEHHTNQHFLPMQTGAWINKGLFVESSQSSPYLLTLERMLDPAAMAWGVISLDGSGIPKADKRAILANQLQRLGFNAIVSPIALRDVFYESQAPLFTINVPRSMAVTRIDGAERLVLIDASPMYFVVHEDALVLVNHELGFFHFTFYKRPSTLPDRGTFVTPEGTYYINKQDAHVYQIDFRLREQVERISTEALKKLQSDIESVPADDFWKKRLKTDVAILQDEIRATNVHYAQKEYEDDPITDLVETGRFSIRENLLEREEAPVAVPFMLYSLPKAPLIELVDKPLFIIDRDWREAIDRWFLSSDTESLPVRAPATTRFEAGPAVLTRQDISANQDRIRFTVESDQPRPVLIKVSYFPKWRATADGKQIPIYRAGPNLMLISAQGNVELRYSTLWYEWLGWLLSGGALLGLALRGLLRARRQRHRQTTPDTTNIIFPNPSHTPDGQ